jgi:anti-sigma B factor antagonist
MIKVEDRGLIKIIIIDGEFNADIGLKAKEIVKECIDKVDLIVISFRNVIYINSSGIRELLDILKIANSKGKKLHLSDMSKEVRELFAFTYLDNVFKIFEDINEALKL